MHSVALATFLVFVSTAVLTMLTWAHFWARAARSMDRLGSRPSYSAALLPSAGLLWQELVEWAGGFLPASPKDASLLKRRLLRAGFRHPSAVRVFRGIQAISAISLALTWISSHGNSTTRPTGCGPSPPRPHSSATSPQRNI